MKDCSALISSFGRGKTSIEKTVKETHTHNSIDDPIWVAIEYFCGISNKISQGALGTEPLNWQNKRKI